MYTIGYDVGSSFIKASLLNRTTDQVVASASSPDTEMEILAHQAGWAEQEPENWWKHLKDATKKLFAQSKVSPEEIAGIGISYQMHGLVPIDKERNVIRPSIIWCDSRAVDYGNEAFRQIGKEQSLSTLLNSPGNFTAAKLKWMKEQEPELYRQIHKILLPGDYIAMKFTDKPATTINGLSEGIFWDFANHRLSKEVMEYFGFSENLIPEMVENFTNQGGVTPQAAKETGLKAGIPITYRAGDQPNNAFSLNVLEPGEIAATAGTSGVVYGVSDQVAYDPQSRVNSFAHVNHSKTKNRLGVLLAVNGTGILNSWLKRNMGDSRLSYEEMNREAAEVPIGSQNLIVFPFGNGAERMLNNRNTGSRIYNLNFNIHSRGHLFRAAQEGIVFSFKYGIEIMKQVGIQPSRIKAGNANMFLSEIFRQALADLTNATIELYDTDGAQGAARGAGIGAGLYADTREAFANLSLLKTIEPSEQSREQYLNAYQQWEGTLHEMLNTKSTE